MSVYVDPLMAHGRILRGREVMSCHLFTDEVDLTHLHRLARMIGCKPEWFQDHSAPHYDLTVSRRQEAIGCGAIAVTRREAVEIWRRRRALIDAASNEVMARRAEQMHQTVVAFAAGDVLEERDAQG